MKRLETELQAARNARAAELEAEAAQLRAGGSAFVAAPAVVPAPAPLPASPPLLTDAQMRAEILARASASDSDVKVSPAALRVERAKQDLRIAVAGLASDGDGGTLAFVAGSNEDRKIAQVVKATDELTNAKAVEEGEVKAGQDFMGLGLGVGLSFTKNFGRDRITAATLDPNGIVRVTDQDNAVARVMLEAHQFFGLGKPIISSEGKETYRYGWGPFVAIQSGDGELIDAIGGGVMFGFRPDANSSKSFNLGVGVAVDPNTQIFGDGIVANQPLPAGETEIRFKKTARYGLLLLTSFGF